MFFRSVTYHLSQKTRDAEEEELLELLVPRLRRMLRAGTTTVECKVGREEEEEEEQSQAMTSERLRPQHGD